jgi:DNA-binding response OmpR family regulator
MSAKRTPSGALPSAPRITIVDDDRDTREMLREVLVVEGYDVQVVANGLRLISSLQVDRPDLVLLDVVMSWMDGFELCRAIKKNPDFKDIPVIFISARGAPQDLEEGYACGCAEYLVKPLDLDVLRARVRSILGEDKE